MSGASKCSTAVAALLGLTTISLGDTSRAQSEPAAGPNNPIVADSDGSSQDAGAPAAPSEDEPTDDVAARDEKQTRWLAEALGHRAQHIRALIAGRLDPAVDAAPLFVMGLVPARGFDPAPEVRALLQSLRDPGRALTDSPPSDSSASGDHAVPAAMADYRRAVLEFFAISPKRRARLLERHEERRAGWIASSQLEERQQRLAEALRERARAIDALVREDPSALSDPAQLMSLDLLALHDDPTAHERIQRLTTVDSAPADDSDDPALPLPARVERARAQLDRALARYLELDPQERRRVVVAHAQRQGRVGLAQSEADGAAERAQAAEREAVKAARAKTEALEAAQAARSEGARRLAEESARLHGLKEDYARLEAGLADRLTRTTQRDDEALVWYRRVRELLTRSVLDGDKGADALQLYQGLVRELDELHVVTTAALTRIGAPSEVEAPQGSELPPEVDTRSVAPSLAGLQGAARDLRALERRVRWSEARSYRDKMVALNQQRLELLPYLPTEYRDEVLGFGPRGMEQGFVELRAITLEARFYGAALPRYFEEQRENAALSSLSGLWLVVKILLLIFAFRWWRRRLPPFIEQARRTWSKRRPVTSVSRLVVAVTYYANRIRSPLEWLAFSALFTSGAVGFEAFPELRYLWLVVSWLLLGWLALRWFDAWIERGRRRARAARTEEGRLRYRSLRLVGMTAVSVGLVLSLTEASVGRGTVYGWAVSLSGLLSLPILATLLLWWRPTVQTRLAGTADRSRLRRWVCDHPLGLLAYPAAAIGGALLLWDGTARVVARKLGGFEISRRIMAYLFQREVAKQSEGQAREANLRPIDPDSVPALAPEGSTPVTVLEPVQEHLERLLADVEAGRSPLTAVVGERGIGKTSFLQILRDRLDQEKVVHVQCEPGRYEGLSEQLRAALGDPKGELSAAVADSHPLLIAVDDAHRLIRPRIGGLRDIDELTALARSTREGITWVLSFDRPGWNYLRRARSDRAIFEEIFELEPWNERHLGALIQKRTELAGMDPSFDALVVPRPLELDDEEDEEARTETDFYRLLWDSAKGNPAVALHLWGASLYHDDGAEPQVRLFNANDPAELNDLAPSIYFVLRSIVQSELVTENEIVGSTGLHPAEVADALHFARGRDFVEMVGDRFRISIAWFRPITLVLRRQHLLAA